MFDKSDDPVIWRGPLIGGPVKQFWTDVIWGELDTLVLDIPPGTGDVAFTVFQSIPLSGILIVTSPQDLVSLIVRKAFKMARAMRIPVLGIVENMSYVACPHCGERIRLFGESRAERPRRKWAFRFLTGCRLIRRSRRCVTAERLKRFPESIWRVLSRPCCGCRRVPSKQLW